MEIGNSKSILLLGGTPEQRDKLCRSFMDEYVIHHVSNMMDALDMLKSTPGISAVIIDGSKPDRIDYSLITEVRMNEKLTRIPVIVVTAINEEEVQAKALDMGAADVIRMPISARVIRHKVFSIIARRAAEAKAEQERLAALRKRLAESEMDEKCGIYNKRGFINATRAMLRKNPHIRYVIVRWDIDNFKVYNDVYGMAAGDELLANIGKAYRRLGFSDITYGRWESDHFVNCVPADDFDAKSASELIDTLIARMKPEYELLTSMGIYPITDNSLDIELMCDRALLPLRSVKDNYQKRYAYYNETMRAAIIDEQMLTAEMDTALREEQFKVYIQPQYNYESGELSGAEALVRWQHPHKGMIVPGRFIPLFERNGFITRLDEFVWRQTCRLIRSWIDKGLRVVPVSVNISRQDIYNPELCDTLVELIREFELTPSLLKLEITETAYTNNPEQLIKVVERLRDSGFYVEMDDFGSGYSSLNILKDVPVDMLKLDMRFLDPQDKSTERSGSILSAVVRMANMIGLAVLAEGVETFEQAEFLKSISCILMQGYYFSRPIPPDEFEALLASGRHTVSPATELKTVSANVDFLNAASQEALIFNSFVGGAGIVEYTGDKVCALRLNDRYFEVLGSNRESYKAYQSNLLDRFVPENRIKFKELLEDAISTGKEAMVELPLLPLNDSGEIWLEIRMRCLAKKGDSYIFYISLDNITQRKRLEEHEQALNRRMSELVNTVPGGIVEYLDDGNNDRFSFVSTTMLSMLGYTREQFNAKFDNRFSHMVWYEDREAVLEYIENAADGAMPSCEYRIETNEGKLKWVLDVRNCIRNEKGERRYIAVIVDNDEKKQLELELSKENADMQSLVDAIPGGVAAYELVDGERFRLLFASDGVAELTGRTPEEYMRRVNEEGIYGISPNDEERVMPVILDTIRAGNDVDMNFRVQHKDGQMIWVNLSGRMVGTHDGNPVFHTIISRQSMATDLFRSIIDEAEDAFIVADLNTRHIMFANAAALKLAGASVENYYGRNCYEMLFGRSEPCENCPLSEMGNEPCVREIEHNGRYIVTRHKRIKWNEHDAFINYLADRTETRAAQRRLETAINSIPGGVVVYKLEDGIPKLTYINSTAYEMLGHGKGESPIEDKLYDLIFAEDISGLKLGMNETVAEQKQFTADFRVKTPSSGLRWVNISANPVRMDDGLLYYYGVFSDIDARKRQENEALERRRELSEIYANMPGGVCRWRLDGVPVLDYAGESYCALTGYTSDELLHRKDACCAGLMTPEDSERMRSIFEEMGRFPQQRVYEYELITKNGEKLSLRCTARSAPGEDGVMRIYEQVYNVTGLKRMEDALHIRAEEYRLCVEHSSIVVFRYILDGRWADIPLDIAQKLGLPAKVKDFPQKLIDNGSILPDSRNDWLDIFNRIESGEDKGSAEIHMELHDGRPHWMSVRFAVIRNSAGKPVTAVMSTKDVTEERNKSKNNTFERSSLFIALRILFPMMLVANLTQNSYYILEYDNYPTKFVKSAGVFDELIEFGLGTVPDEDKQAFEDAFSREKLLASLERGNDVVRLEHRQFGGDGELHWIETMVMHVPNPYDDDVLELTIARPIDERKGFEQKLVKKLESTSDALIKRNYYTRLIRQNLHSIVELRFSDDAKPVFRLGSLAAMYGCSDDELDALRNVGSGSAGKARAAAEAAMLEHESRYDVEYRVTLPDGSEVWMHERGERFCEESGRQGYVIITSDNTAVRSLLERVRMSEEELRLSIAHMGTFLLRYDIKTRTMTVPEVYARLWNVSETIENVPECLYEMETLCYDEDAKRLLKEQFENIANGVPSGEYEHHFIRGTTGEAWEHTDFVTLFDADGNPTRAVLSVTDTTERHIADAENEALRKNAQIMRAVSEHSGRVAYFYDFSTGIARALDANRAVSIGMPESCEPESLVNADMIFPDSKDAFKSLIAQMRGGVPRGDTRVHMHTADGAERWLEMWFSDLTDDAGLATGAVISFVDITDRHMHELAYARYMQSIEDNGGVRSMFFDIDLTADVVENHGGELLPDGVPEAGGSYDELLNYMADNFFKTHDRAMIMEHFSREHILAMYASGVRDTADEWLVNKDGGSEYWARISLQLVSDPYTEHVRALYIIHDITAAKERQLSVQRQAERDGLTEIYNRATAQRLINERLSESKEYCAFMILDLDNLKEINDTLGHGQGDRALCAIADELSSRFRTTDVVGRLGGDEFVVFLTNLAGDPVLDPLLSGMVRKLSSIAIGENNDWMIHCSIGCAIGASGKSDFETLYRRADMALYQVKRHGKNDYAIYSSDMESAGYRHCPHEKNGQISRRIEDEDELRRLFETLAGFYPTIIGSNLTRGTLRVVQTGRIIRECCKDANETDVVKIVYDRVHPDEREALRKMVSSENLIEAHGSGKTSLSGSFRFRGMTGEYIRFETAILFYHNDGGDLCAFILGRSEEM